MDEGLAEEPFRHKVLALLRRRGLLSLERIELVLSWRRSGFAVHNRVHAHPEDGRDFEALVHARKGGHDASEPGEDVMLAAPRPESSWVGERLPRETLAESGGAQVVAIVRGETVLVPDSKTLLEAEHILVLVLDPEGWSGLEGELARVHRLSNRS